MLINKYMIKYEFLSTLFSGYAFGFGCLFPIVMFYLIKTSSLSGVPQAMQPEILAEMFIGFSLIIPLATVFLSYAANYAVEKDKNIPERMHLFGLKESQILASRIVSNFIFLTVCFMIYILAIYPFVEIAKPTLSGLLVYLFLLYLLAIILIILAHGIASLINGFGLTYALTMIIYFLIMIFSGLMGLQVSQMPSQIRFFARLLPTYHLGDGFIDFWLGKAYNMGPLIQSYIFFGCIALLVIIIANKLKARN